MCDHPMHDHEAAAERQLDAAGAEPVGSKEQQAAIAMAGVEATLALAHAVNRIADQGDPMLKEVEPLTAVHEAPYSVMTPENYADALEEAAQAGWLVEFDYDGGSDPGSRRRVLPTDLFTNRRGADVLLGEGFSHDAYRSFRLDRMSRLTVEVE